jgi:hypothetical protein
MTVADTDGLRRRLAHHLPTIPARFANCDAGTVWMTVAESIVGMTISAIGSRTAGMTRKVLARPVLDRSPLRDWRGNPSKRMEAVGASMRAVPSLTARFFSHRLYGRIHGVRRVGNLFLGCVEACHARA